MRTTLALFGALLLAGPAAAQHQHHAAQQPATGLGKRMKAPADAYVYVGYPNDGETVGRGFKVWFGTRNFGVAPPGIDRANTGHHHC